MKITLLFLFVLTTQVVFAQNHNNDIATIKSYRTESNEAIEKHDVDGIAKFWMDDFVQVIGRGYLSNRETKYCSFLERTF